MANKNANANANANTNANATPAYVWKDYINYQETYQKKYGQRTICFMQVGSFYELYSLTNIGYIKDICDLLNITLTRKNKYKEEIDKNNPFMAGVHMDNFSWKFLPILIENNYTVVIIDQQDAPASNLNKSTKTTRERKVSAIYSKATAVFDSNTTITPDANNILCLYFTSEKSCIYLGMSVMDISTGKCYVAEISNQYYSIPEEICRYMESFRPTEIIIYNLINDTEIPEKAITQNIPESILNLAIYHYYTLDDVDNKSDLQKVAYQNQFFKKIYKESGYLSPIEFIDLERQEYARFSFLLLCRFVFQHDEKNISNITIPMKYNDSRYLVIYNNALEQLDIVGDNKSLFAICNKTYTNMGRRELFNRLTAPIIDTCELNSRYDLAESCLQSIEPYAAQLRQLVDVERYSRKLYLKVIHPHELATYIKSLRVIQNIIKINQESAKNVDTDMTVEPLIKYAETYYNLAELEKYKNTDVFTHIFRNGAIPEIDELILPINESFAIFQKMIDQFNDIITRNLGGVMKKGQKDIHASISDSDEDDEDNDENNDEDNDDENTSKSPSYFRVECIENKKKTLRKNGRRMNDRRYAISCSSIHATAVKKFYVANGGHPKLTITKLNKRTVITAEEIETLSDTIVETVLHKEIHFQSILKRIIDIDVAVSTARCIRDYNYCRPQIDTTRNENSYLIAKELRHPIVERNKNDTYFVPNDAEITGNGMLIYGVNACGKSTYMKSVGCAIIMAQAGLFVPAEFFMYKPYHYLFTRITGNDDIRANKSSFEVEMTELRSILKYANKDSIILGDEVCKGTESVSGTAIMAAAIRRFSNRKIGFILTSHMHALTSMKEVISINSIKIYHLIVENNNGKLTYHRKLVAGAGESIYGLEVARCILNDKDLIADALKIRRNMLGLHDDILPIHHSKYNSDVYVDKCQIKDCCERSDLEVHHIRFQSSCNQYGFHDHIPKNVKCNLVVLCHRHHEDIHVRKILHINGFKDTSEGVELDYTFKEPRKPRVSKKSQTQPQPQPQTQTQTQTQPQPQTQPQTLTEE
jgi:DNA mismatch repair protein MutS